MNNIYFYEVYASNYNRYVIRVAEYLMKDNNSVNLFFIKENYEKDEIKLTNDRINIISVDEVKKYCKKYSPDAFVNFGFRIPDLYWTQFFKKKNARTIQVQHGIYIDHFQRSTQSFFDDLGRRLRYLVYMSKIILTTNNVRDTLGAMLSKDFKFHYNKNKIDDRIVSNDLVLWGKYWEEWYKENLFYNDTSLYHICGGFDYDLLSEDQSFVCEAGSSSYICQSLVEDGRLSFNIFNEFLERLLEFLNNSDKKLYVKLHPRSNIDFYKLISDHKNVEFTNKFPISDHYIGHYSTLLTLCYHLKKNILLMEFPGHKAPQIIKDISTRIIGYNDHIDFSFDTQNENADVDFYCEFNPNPFKAIANVVSDAIH